MNRHLQYGHLGDGELIVKPILLGSVLFFFGSLRVNMPAETYAVAQKKLFGTSGVRGVVHKELSAHLLTDLGRAIATSLPPHSWILIANDSRQSRFIVKDAVKKGLIAAGARVLDVGMLPTPAVAYLTKTIGISTGIMVTASHNPPEYNGIKLFNIDGMGYSGEQEQKIETIFFSKKFRKDEGSTQTAFDLRDYYFENLIQPLGPNYFSHKFKVVVDPGSGAASVLATNLFYDLGLDVIPVNDLPDGSFPGRAPEPREDTLKGTYELLLKEHADLAICFDGDADRVVFMDEQGFIGYDESITFIAALAVKLSNKKVVATTVETGKLLDIGLQGLGGQVMRGTVGDMPVSYLTRSANAAIGVEPVGVYIMPDAGFYPNSFLAAITLIKNIKNVDEIRSFFKNLPQLHKKQLKVPCLNNAKFTLMKKVLNHYNLFGSGEPNTLDGLRLENRDSWTLIRPSGTEPIIRISAESLTEAKTQELMDQANMAITGLMRD